MGATVAIADGLRRRRAVALPADVRRSLIIDAALPLLLAEGAAFKTKDVAEAAGIAEGTIYRLFASKDELIEAVMTRVYDPAPTEAAIAAINPDDDLEAVVIQAVKLLQRRATRVWELDRSLGPRFHRHDRRRPTDSAALIQLFEHHRRELGVEPAVAARLLRATTLALSIPTLAGRTFPAKQIARQFLFGATVAPC